jgi:hypothetical protein
MCEHGTHEMVRVKIPADLSHTGEARWKDCGIDACIAPLVRALQEGGIDMRASCCGHGKTHGTIDLADGRRLVIQTPGIKTECLSCEGLRVVRDIDSGSCFPCPDCSALAARSPSPVGDALNAAIADAEAFLERSRDTFGIAPEYANEGIGTPAGQSLLATRKHLVAVLAALSPRPEEPTR